MQLDSFYSFKTPRSNVQSYGLPLVNEFGLDPKVALTLILLLSNLICPLSFNWMDIAVSLLIGGLLFSGTCRLLPRLADCYFRLRSFQIAQL